MRAAVVALQHRGLLVHALVVAAAVEHGVGVEGRARDRLPVGLQAGVAEADRAGALVAPVVGHPHLRAQLGAAGEAVHVIAAQLRRPGVVDVAGHPVVVLRVGGPEPAFQPRQAVVDAVVVLQVVQPDGELVGGADAPAEGGRDAALVDRRPPALGVGHHGVDAKRRILARPEVEVADAAQVAPAAERDADLVLRQQHRLLAHLVDRATGRAAAEQHRRRAAQHLEPVPVEAVALVERGVAHAVDEDVARSLQREAAQPDVLLGALGGDEADAGGIPQRFLQGVEVAVVDQPLGDDGHRLRDVAQLLLPLADARRRRAHGVLVGLGLGAHRHRGQRRARRRGLGRRGGLREARVRGQRCRQQRERDQAVHREGLLGSSSARAGGGWRCASGG